MSMFGKASPYLVSHHVSDGSDHRTPGIYQEYKFPNGYGASVIKHRYSYGGKDGLWEVAVLDSEGNICYDTPITSDVLGHLNDPEVDSVLTNIYNL